MPPQRLISSLSRAAATVLKCVFSFLGPSNNHCAASAGEGKLQWDAVTPFAVLGRLRSRGIAPDGLTTCWVAAQLLVALA